MKEKTERLWNSNYTKVWFANFWLYFSFMLLTPLFPLYLSEQFDANKQTIGLVLSGYTLTALIIRFFSGYLVDSFPRKIILLVSFGLFALFFTGYPIASSLWLFAIVRTLHGAPFGVATVSNSTVAIDVLPSTRRAEGIGYYGLSNNVATAISPSVALFIYSIKHSYDTLFALAIACSLIAFLCNVTVKTTSRPLLKRPPMSFDRFIMLKAWRHIICMACFAFAYGIISTYIAIYGKEELGITGGTGLFFMLLSIGLILSRLTGSRTLRQGKITQNASIGIAVSVIGYLLFATVHNYWGYYGAAFIIGLGNGHMFPAFQSMFINLAPNERRGTANSTLYVSWDTGFGLGVLLGGFMAEHAGYHAAFYLMVAVKALGAVLYYWQAKGYFLQYKLR